jgi:hypothetical protein
MGTKAGTAAGDVLDTADMGGGAYDGAPGLVAGLDESEIAALSSC